MFRSVSSSRVSEDSYYSIYNHSPTSKAVSPALRALALEANELPQYETSPFSTKKDKLGRLRFSEKAVHLIPLVLLLCALVLWLFSNPDIEMPIRNDLIAVKVKGATNRYGNGASTTRLKNPHASMVDIGFSKHKEGHKIHTSFGNQI